jgi:hypothetical protein
MYVEDYHISDDDDPTVTITGRGFESFLENRIVGSNKALPAVGEPKDVILDGDWYTWIQAVSLMARHTQASYLVDDKNALYDFEIQHNVPGTTGTKEERSIPRQGLHQAVVSILEVDNLGIKTLRPGKYSAAEDPAKSVILVHRGVDRSSTISLSYDSGDLEQAEYFYSNQKVKNCALVTSKWLEVLVDSSATGVSRRMMTLDASDLDDAYNSAPAAGATRDLIIARMTSRGKQAIAAQKNIALSNVTVSSTGQSRVYGTDYGMGDIVMVRGNYQEARKMRVTEYVEIEDENGNQAYPTLTELETT